MSEVENLAAHIRGLAAEIRALGTRAGDDLFWVWIGTHSDLDKVIG